MRILITGGTGLLGWWLAKTFYSKGYTVFAIKHSKNPFGLDGINWLKLDITDYSSVTETVRGIRPDIVIHSAAYTNVDGCEENRSLAYRTNFLGTLNLVRAVSKEEGILFVYISTDYVFDGRKGLYVENDIPYPVNYYGLTKLLGEAISVGYDESIIIRVSGLYGYSPTGKKNFAVKTVEKLLRGEHVKAFKDQFLSPTYVPELARMIYELLLKDFRGTIHLAGERTSRYNQAILIAKALKVDEDFVEPVSLKDVNLKAPRPVDSSLDTKVAFNMGIKHAPIEEAIRDFVTNYINEIQTR